MLNDELKQRGFRSLITHASLVTQSYDEVTLNPPGSSGFGALLMREPEDPQLIELLRSSYERTCSTATRCR